jgi:AMMECR1 domain-containing protein
VTADPVADGDREALRELLVERGFVSTGDGRALFDRAGALVPWMYYGGEVNLTFQGVTLMAAVVLERLKTFSSTQLTTYGVSAIPILTACLTEGAGRYTGLVVRKEPKSYGEGRKIDGPIDRARPAVVIDESISSGTSAYNAIWALEAEGIAVEGVICVVEFSGYGGKEWLIARGYRVETVFDVWRDLGRPGPRRPTAPEVSSPWAADVLPSGLSPAQAARAVVEVLLRSGRLPRPPKRLDRDYAAAGGTFVSIRRLADDVRVVRAGLSRGEDEDVDPAHDLVLAAHEVVRSAPSGALDDLAALKFSVSFLDRREPISAGQIDYERHALVVRGLGPLDRLGVALPNAPHYDDELEQYHYARTVSARFGQHEPHALYRQRVERVVEPGVSWPEYGAPRGAPDWTREPSWARTIARRVQRILRDALGERPAGAVDPLPQPEEPVFGVGVSIYADGLVGCAVSWASGLDVALREAVIVALDDRRTGARARTISSDRLTVVVSLLLRRRWLGCLSPDRLALFYRLGRDTLRVDGLGEAGTVLAHFAVEQSLDGVAYQQQVLEKAGLSAGTAEWSAYETACWTAVAGQGQRMELGFTVRDPDSIDERAHWRSLAMEIAGFILGQRQADGLPAYRFDPWSAKASTPGTATRVLLGLTGVLEASPLIAVDVAEEAKAMVASFVAGDQIRLVRNSLSWDRASDAQLLACLSLLGGRDEHRALALRLATQLRALIRNDGAIHAGSVRVTSDLDFLSGSVLCALACAADWLPRDVLAEVDLAKSLEFYRRRFGLSHPWGMVWWHGQAWSGLADRVPGAAQFAFELIDWALERQSATSGAFVIQDQKPTRASFLTACVLEGVAEAWALTRRLGDLERAERYGRAWRHGMTFIERLTIRNGDAFFSPHPATALGGVRATLPSSELRIDYAGHALLALAKGLRVQ